MFPDHVRVDQRYEQARAKVKADQVCPTCQKFLANEFAEDPETGVRFFDGVICEDRKAYHHGCEPC